MTLQLSSIKKAAIAALASVPFAVAGAFTNSDPAQAISFNVGDTLNITGAYTPVLNDPLKLTFNDAPGGDGDAGYGNFGVVNPTTTGSFEAFETNGTVDTGYDILNVDFGDLTTYLNQDFLKLDNNVDSFKFIITAPVVKSPYSGSVPGITFGGVVALMTGKFVNASNGEALGFGNFTANFNNENGSFSGTFTVTSVPEPTTILGLGVVGAGLVASRRRKANQAS